MQAEGKGRRGEAPSNKKMYIPYIYSYYSKQIKLQSKEIRSASNSK